MQSNGHPLRRRLLFVLAQTLGLVILADWLFYPRSPRTPLDVFAQAGAEPWAPLNDPTLGAFLSATAPAPEPVFGVNVAIFCAALVTAVLLRGAAAWRTWAGRLLVLGILGLVIALAREPGGVAIAMSIVCLAALAIVDRQGWTASAALRALELLSFTLDAIRRPLHDLYLLRRWRRTREVHPDAAPRPAVPALRWLIPIAMAAIFIGLFAIANPVISEWLENLPDLPPATRLMLWFSVGFATWGLLRARARHRATTEGDQAGRTVGATFLERLGGWDWMVPSLVIFNAIFAVQTALDLLYLFARADLPEGVTYAEYAHRGAYPLIITALLAGWFVLVAFRPGGRAERHLLPRRLVQVWIAQNILLTVTAMWRLALYVDVYSLTRLRVAAAIWMVLVAIGLGLLIMRIACGHSNRWLLNRTTWATACVLYACSFIGFNRLIAEYNVTHCREVARTGDPDLASSLRRVPLDIHYLVRLGPPALPALHRYLVATADAPGNVLDVTVDGDDAWRADDLDSRRGIDQRALARDALQRLEAELDRTLINWRGWTFTRAALHRDRPLRTAMRGDR